MQLNPRSLIFASTRSMNESVVILLNDYAPFIGITEIIVSRDDDVVEYAQIKQFRAARQFVRERIILN